MKSSLTELLAELLAIDLTAQRNHPTKKVDSHEVELGTLPEDMQRLWVLTRDRRTTVDDIVQRIEDRASCHKIDTETHGVLEEVCRKHMEEINTLLEELRKPGVDHKILLHIFDELLSRDFQAAEGKPVLCIREGFKVVCRDNDVRGDHKDPYAGIREHLCSSVIVSVVFMDKKEEPATSEKSSAPAAPSNG